MRQSTRPFGGSCLINHAYQRFTCKGRGKISDRNSIHLLRLFLFLDFRSSRIDNSVSRHLENQDLKSFKRSRQKWYTAAYARELHPPDLEIFMLASKRGKPGLTSLIYPCSCFRLLAPASGLSRSYFEVCCRATLSPEANYRGNLHPPVYTDVLLNYKLNVKSKLF